MPEPIGFMLWMREIDRVLQYVYGVSADDLPDMDYRSYYADGMTAAEAVEAIQEEMDAR
jgi:hypothetical protein